MNHSVLLISIILIICIFIFMKYIFALKAKKFRKNLKALFGSIPSRENDFESISSYWQQRILYEDSIYCIDDISWNDLDMDKIFARINACNSSCGEENLYSMLREPKMDNKILLQREKLMKCLHEKPDLRLDIQVILSKVGIENYNGLSSFCYDVKSKKLNTPYVFTILAVLPLLFAALLVLKSPVIILCLAACVIINGIVYYYISKRIVRGMYAIRYFSSILWGAEKIIKICDGIDNEILNNLRTSFDIFKSLRGRLSGIAQQRLTDIDFLIEYIRIIFLTNIRNYNKLLDAIEKNNSEFRLLYNSVGQIDSLISVLSFRQSLSFYSCPVFTPDNKLIIKDIYHPLLTSPVPNSNNIIKNSLISGSNASGKSTFIKAVAINGIMAQTIHTCAARLYQTRPVFIITSMAVKDDITHGESYFITEIKSLKRILQKIPHIHCICIIDEILKGTNTIERIASSVSVLNYLSKLDCLCIAATHDIELTRMLADKYDNFHFSEQIASDGIRFDYKIKEGASRTKNAIKLLEHMGFDQNIIENAQKLVKIFEETKTWDIKNI